MTSFQDLLAPASVFIDLPARTKKQLFAALAERAAPLADVTPAKVAEVLTARERLGSTGFGGGIAIPHGKLDHLDQAIGVFARLAEPLDYGAIDSQPVDIVVMMLSPAASGMLHLKALAGISRSLRDQGLLARLRGAGSADALYALLSGDGAHDIA